MKVTRVLCLLVVFSSVFSTVSYADLPRKGQKICLVLKGGGALGFAHVGVLKVLEELRVPVHCIAGTSMGAIVGASYATGNSISHLEKVLSETDWNDLFDERIPRSELSYRMKPGRERELFGDAKLSFGENGLKVPLGFIEGQKIVPLFQRLFGHLSVPTQFDQLPVPFRAVAADIETGESYEPAQGNLADVVRASMSVPAAFSPVRIENKVLVDGGIVKNLPVDVALGMGADVLLVVDLYSPLPKADTLGSPLAITNQMISLLLLQNSAQQLKYLRPQDVRIEVDVTGYDATQFAEGVSLMQLGEGAARDNSNLLSQLAVSEHEYAQYDSQRTGADKELPPLAFVRLKNSSSIPDSLILNRVRLHQGDLFDVDTVEEDIAELHNTGFFTTVRYDLVRQGNETGLQIEVIEKEWLNDFIRFGFALEDDFSGEDSFSLAAAYRVTGLNNRLSYAEIQGEIGKRKRVQLEWYQLYSGRNPFFFAPLISLTGTDLPVRSGGEEIARYERLQGIATLRVGYDLSGYGEVTLGATRGFGDLERDIGSAELPEFGYDIGDFRFTTSIDTVDTPDFPTEGVYARFVALASSEDIGASDNFEQLIGTITKPLTWNRKTLLLSSTFGETFGTLPVERSFSLGGFLNVSGFGRDALAASNFVQGSTTLYGELLSADNPLFDLGLFGGTSFELTSFSTDSSALEEDNLLLSGSVFVGADTPLFPAYLAFGISDENEHSFYLLLGRIGRNQ